MLSLSRHLNSKRQRRQQQRSSHIAPRPEARRWLWLALPAVALLVGLALLSRHSREQDSGSSGDANSASPSTTTPEPSETSIFATYAGSATCQDCHADEFNAWQTSNHGLAERSPNAQLDEAAFHPSRSFRHGSQRSEPHRTNGAYHVTALGPNGYAPFPVERVIGHDPLRQFLVPFPGGRLQTLEASYDPHRNEWFNVYGNEDRQPGEWGHWTGRGMNWNSMCASCHNTRVRKNYDEASDTYRTTMAERTVSCEACHGPLKAHHDWQRQHRGTAAKDPTLTKLTREQTVDNCGFCHARRSDLTGDFRPGDKFADRMRLSVVDASDTYYPDGQVREENYEFSAFVGSRMHFRGVACNDCHQPHSTRTILPGNALCMRCHNGSVPNAPIIQPVAHSQHRVFGYDTNGNQTNFDLAAYKPKAIIETGGECVNCHMPQTTYMQRHPRHDHGFTIPDPLLTKQHGIPNACNRCHQDKNADWSLGWVEKWYGEKMNRPSRRRAQVIASARQGQPGARDGLLDLAAREEIPYWRAVASGLLQPWAAEPAVRDTLLRGLADTNELVREASVRSLEPLLDADPARVGGALRARLVDPVRSVRLAAAWALRATLAPDSPVGRELALSLDINADQPTGQMQKGAYALARNDPQKALTHYAKAIAWDSNSAAIHHDYAVVLSGLDRSAEAITHLERACTLEPRNADYRYMLALGWNEAGQPEKTLEALQAAVQIDPNHARAWYNLGLALNGAGRTEEGIIALRRAETADARDPRAPYARATILARLGRLNEAREAARRALEIQPGYPPAQEFLQSLR